MRNVYIRKVKNSKILKANIQGLRKQYLSILKRMKQQRDKKIQNKAYFKDLA